MTLPVRQETVSAGEYARQRGAPINLGVIAAGLLVLWTRSNEPDLVVGAVVFAVVVMGAVRILKVAR